MLASAAQVKKAMELSPADVREAMRASGYSVTKEEVLDARFKGFNGTQFVYEITYPNPEDEGTATGNVYVSLKRRAFHSEFEFIAEY